MSSQNDNVVVGVADEALSFPIKDWVCAGIITLSVVGTLYGIACGQACCGYRKKLSFQLVSDNFIEKIMILGAVDIGLLTYTVYLGLTGDAALTEANLMWMLLIKSLVMGIIIFIGQVYFAAHVCWLAFTQEDKLVVFIAFFETMFLLFPLAWISGFGLAWVVAEAAFDLFIDSKFIALALAYDIFIFDGFSAIASFRMLRVSPKFNTLSGFIRFAICALTTGPLTSLCALGALISIVQQNTMSSIILCSSIPYLYIITILANIEMGTFNLVNTSVAEMSDEEPEIFINKAEKLRQIL